MNRKKIHILNYLIALGMGILFIIISPLSYYGDMSQSSTQAKNLLAGNGLSMDVKPPYSPDVYRSPGMGFFLYAIYSITGINSVIPKLIQAALNAFIPIFIFYISMRTFNERFALIVSFAVAIYPFTTLYVHTLDTDALGIFVFCLGVFLFEKGRESGKFLFFTLSGFVWGYSLLVRPNFALFPFFLTVTYIAVANFKKIWKQLLVFNFCVLLVWTPWILRNYLVTGKFIPLTVEGKEIIYWATGSIGKYSENRLDNPKFRKQMEKIERDMENSGLKGIERVIKRQDLFLENAIKNISDEPLLWFSSSVKRIPRMWISSLSNDRGSSYGYEIFKGKQIIFTAVKYFLIGSLIFSLYGLWLIRQRWRQSIFMILPLVYFSVTLMFIHAEARYTLPARPFLTVFTLIGLFGIFKKSVFK